MNFIKSPEISTSSKSKRLRVLMGKNEDPSVRIVDSQSVKTTEKKGSAGLMEARKLRVGKDTYWLITLDS